MNNYPDSRAYNLEKGGYKMCSTLEKLKALLELRKEPELKREQYNFIPKNKQTQKYYTSFNQLAKQYSIGRNNLINLLIENDIIYNSTTPYIETEEYFCPL